jgi:hypothetical protein
MMMVNEMSFFFIYLKNKTFFVLLELDLSSQKTTESTASYTRTAPPESQSFYSTIRLVISVRNEMINEENRSEQHQRLKSCYTHFMEFFQRNHINDCFGIITSVPSTRDISSLTASFMNNETIPFIKQYCWQMLLSIGYRFQQRISKGFIKQMNLIDDDDEFYQVKEQLLF